MGHLYLTRLPMTKKWKEVVDLLGEGAGAAQVASGTLAACEDGLDIGGGDPGLVHAFWLLTQIPVCARSTDFAAELRSRGMAVSGPASLMEIVASYSDAIDAHLRREGGRTDLGEIAQHSGAESLIATIAPKARGLFGVTSDDVRREFAGLHTVKQFGTLATDFFARLTRRYLSSFLSREIANHVGKDKPIANIKGHAAFNEALDLHCKQAARAVEKFAGEWFSKANWEGGITKGKAAGFVTGALEKLRAALERGGDADE